MKELKKFGIGLAVILTLVGLAQLWRGREKVSLWFFGAAIFVLTVAFLFPLTLKPVFFVFAKAGRVIGWFNTRLLLSLIFYGIFTPMGLAMKLAGRDLLDRKIAKDSETYWKKREKVYLERGDFKKQF